MFIKRMCRKPLLLLLLLLVILVGNLFPVALSQAIEKSYGELEELYTGIVIQCKLIPQIHIGASFSLQPEIGDRIVQMDEVSEYYCELKCPYYFRDPGPSFGNSMAYGTNDVYRFAEEHGLELRFSAGKTDVDFSGEENICLVSERLLDAASCNIGDTVTVAGSALMIEKDADAPDLELIIVGAFKSEDTDVPWNAIIVPKACFFDTAELISTQEGIQKWRAYTTFDFKIDQAYNRTFDTVKVSLQSIVGEKWLLYSTSRELYRAVQPLEKKLATQQILFRIVTLLFLFLPVLVICLLCKKDRNEVLIRMIYGEKAGRVFWTSWVPYIGVCFLCGILSFAIAKIIGYFNWWNIVSMLSVSILASGIAIGLTCRTKLIKLYQSRE